MQHTCDECDAIQLFAHYVAEGEQVCGLCGHAHRHRLFFPEQLPEGVTRIIAALQASCPHRATRRTDNTRVYNAYTEVVMTPRPRSGAITVVGNRWENLRSVECRIMEDDGPFERTRSGMFRAPGPPPGPDSGSASPHSAPSAPSSGASIGVNRILIGVNRIHWSAANPTSLPAQAPGSGGIQVGCDAWSVVRKASNSSPCSDLRTIPRVLRHRLTSSPVASGAGGGRSVERVDSCQVSLDTSFSEISGDAYSPEYIRSTFTSATLCDANTNLVLAQEVSPAQLEARVFSATSSKLTGSRQDHKRSSWNSSSSLTVPRVLESRRLPCPRRDMCG